jgi:hypothetical protein
MRFIGGSGQWRSRDAEEAEKATRSAGHCRMANGEDDESGASDVAGELHKRMRTPFTLCRWRGWLQIVALAHNELRAT